MITLVLKEECGLTVLDGGACVDKGLNMAVLDIQYVK